MTTIVPDLVYGTPTAWAFAGQFAGGEAEVIINGMLSGIKEYGDTVIVDGLTIWTTNTSANPKRYTPEIYSATRGGATVAHFLDSYSILAAGIDARSYFPLGIPSALTSAPLVRIALDPAAGIIVLAITAWGHFPPGPAQPLDVKVQEVHFLPQKKAAGPM